ncbi:MAG TPA: thioredoxin domain-containing protein, partial [Alphaproteobacteria bacterium]|nr:thioredoxin domain-containing protein [Alphaproteobacteria bacterium]
DGEPFWGGTYFPPDSRWGRPGFPDVLRAIADTYAREPDKVAKNVAALRDGLARLSENRAGGGVPEEAQDAVAERLLAEINPVHGGLGGAPKFPQTGILALLWRAWQRTGREDYRNAVTNTLTRMAQGGIYDHLGGGFARYSTDAEWLAPHFEKMLYDNAELVELLTLVWQETGDPLYAARVRETVDWVLREMVAEGGAFAATLDADSEGEEGRFYVWREDEIEDVLKGDAPLFKDVYDVTPDGNWEGRTILNRRHHPDLLPPETEERLAGLRARLLERRSGRVRPGWDDKVLADWNGLMIAALAEAGMVFEEPGWIAAGERAFAFVRDRMVIGGRLHHAARADRVRHRATLDDYANMSRAALALYEATGDGAYLETARGWAEDVERHYRDAERGGYFFTAEDAEALIVRTKTAYDNPTPSGNGTMLGVLARLFHLTGEARYAERAEAVVQAFAGELTRNFFPLATFLNNAAFWRNALQVVIVGDRRAEETRPLLRAVLDRSLPDRLLLVVPPGEALPQDHPASGKGQVDGRPTAYVCRQMTCAAPVTEAAALGALLDG